MPSDLPINAYFRGKIVPYADAKVGVLTNALHYGTAVFGGLRGYWSEADQQLFIFRPVDHYRRFLNSSKILRMELEYTPESLTKLTVDLLRADGHHCDVYIRPLAYKADEAIGVKLHGLIDELTIVSVPMLEAYVHNADGAHVTISSWRRVDDNMVPARGKISGSYANSALIKSDATLAGFDEALVLTQDGHISEGSAMNVFMVRDGVLITPPPTENILEGITRRSVIEIAQDLGIQVVERQIDRTETIICDEMFFTGTAAQVTPITRIDHRPVGSGQMGPVCARLSQTFEEILRNKVVAYRKWLVPVY